MYEKLRKQLRASFIRKQMKITIKTLYIENITDFEPNYIHQKELMLWGTQRRRSHSRSTIPKLERSIFT